MKIALIKNAVVENTIICGSVKEAAELFPGYSVVDIDGVLAGTGWTYDGKNFKAPEIVKTPEEIASENMATARSEYDRATDSITALNEQIEDEDYADTPEDAVKMSLTAWTEYRKALRAYIRDADGSRDLPTGP